MLEAPNAQFVKLSTILTSRNLLFASSFFVAGAAFRMPGMHFFVAGAILLTNEEVKSQNAMVRRQQLWSQAVKS